MIGTTYMAWAGRQTEDLGLCSQASSYRLGSRYGHRSEPGRERSMGRDTSSMDSSYYSYYHAHAHSSSTKLAGKRLRKESHVPRPIPSVLAYGHGLPTPLPPLAPPPYGLPIATLLTPPPTQYPTPPYGLRTVYTGPLPYPTPPPPYPTPLYTGYSANFLIYMYRGRLQEGRELMTERCTECEAVLRIAGMPSYGLETIRVCGDCGKIYTGEMLEWNVVNKPSTTESSTVPVNQRQSARRGITTHKYAVCKGLRQIDSHLL